MAEQRQEWECIGGDGKQRKEATFCSQISFISALNGHETTSAFIQVKKKKKKKVQDMSTTEMLKHLVRSTNEVSPPFPGVTATKGSAAGLVILKEQELLCSISRSSYHVLH